MAVLNVYNLAGDQTGTLEVNDAVFGIEPNKVVLHEVLTAELAAARQGTASTKTRAMVRGGGRKPFKQKGTGRARQGSIRAPHMVGGGVTFGPHPRSYEKKVNKKVRNLALRSALSDLIKDYNLYLSARNLENAVILQPNEIGVYWLLKQEKVILTKEALAVVEEVLG